MRHSSSILAVAASISAATASAVQGFNYGSTDSDGAVRDQDSYETAFATAKNLVGTDNAFTSARLYTMIQGGTTNTPTSAIPAAIKEQTTLLLTLWSSGTTFDQELAALTSAITTYGSDFADLVTGISVGSEDLYRNSPTGIAAGSYVGQEPSVLVDYISQVRKAISGTVLSDAKVGHVDTWTAWVNGSNSAVIDACDWLGFDGYPYWQSTDDNTVENGKSLFQESYDKTVAVAGSKEVWVTETGWAVTDSKGSEGEATPGTVPAKTYWDDVGCDLLFGSVNTWWYTLSDASSTPSFGVSSSDSNTTPLYDLSCTAKNTTSSSSASTSGSTTATSSALSAGTTGTGSSLGGSSGSGSNGTYSSATLTAVVSTATSGSTATGSSSSSSSTATHINTSGAGSVSMSLAAVLGAGALALWVL